MEGQDAAGKRQCPVCDEDVSMDATVCPSCSTDLTLFTPEEASELPTDAEELKSSILSEGDGHMSDLLKVADEDVLPSTTDSEEVFECPECGTQLPMDATSCVKCGVEFEVEEVFECPLCKTLIDINVEKCPSCNAEFAEESEGEKEEPAKPQSFTEKVKEGPPTSEPAKPLSFAERMKDKTSESPPTVSEEKPKSFADRIKDKTSEQPETVTPEKPASFADRMKTLKGDPPIGDSGEKPKEDASTVKTPTKSKAKDDYKELPTLIGEVKKLLALAKEHQIDISKNKLLIAQAVSASKKKDLANAIKMIKQGKTGLEKDLRTSTMGKHRTLTTAASIAKKGGQNVVEIQRVLDNVKKSVDDSDFQAANSELKRVEDMVESLSGTTTITQVKIESISGIIEDALALGVNIAEAKDLYEKATKASEEGNALTVTTLTKEINDKLMKILPRYIANEMRRAKSDLREIKMMNVDISKPVDILKVANNAVKDGDYGSALHSIKEFKDFIEKIK
jgi:hypothetical protein